MPHNSVLHPTIYQVCHAVMVSLTPPNGSPSSIPLCSAEQAAHRVGILLCTFNGERYLREQLDSFLTQTYSNWHLYVSDDGSTDTTKAILAEYQQIINRRMTVLRGPQKGFAQNFMSLIRNMEIICQSYAFSDQDDIWLPDKLARSLSSLANKNNEIPILYCSRTKLIDKQGRHIGFTPSFQRRPSFKNALVQSIAGANTMMINETARQLLRQTPEQAQIVAHDWLTYLVVSSCGGIVVYDPVPTLLYRQHEENLIGANSGIFSRFSRIYKMLGGRFRAWNEKNIDLMNNYLPDMTTESIQSLTEFKKMRDDNFFKRVKALRNSGVYRQTLAGNLSLYLAVILKQV